MSTFPCAQCQSPIEPPPGAEGLYVPCPYCGFHVPVPSDAPTAFAVGRTAPPPNNFLELPEAPLDPLLLRELPDPLPADIEALGPPLAVFRYQGRDSPMRLFLGALVLAVGLNLSLAFAWPVYWTSSRLIDWERFLLAAVPLTAVNGYVVTRVLGSYSLRIVVFAGGFLWSSCFRRRVCRWNQIRWAQRLWVPLSRRWVYRVETDDGRFFYFNNQLERLDDLGQIILRETARHLLQRALADHDAGRTVEFNQFKVTKTGVCYGRDSLEWSRIRVAQKLKTRVWIWQWDQEKPWAQVDADEVSHPDVFVSLVNTILAERRDGRR